MEEISHTNFTWKRSSVAKSGASFFLFNLISKQTKHTQKSSQKKLREKLSWFLETLFLSNTKYYNIFIGGRRESDESIDVKDEYRFPTHVYTCL